MLNFRGTKIVTLCLSVVIIGINSTFFISLLTEEHYDLSWSVSILLIMYGIMYVVMVVYLILHLIVSLGGDSRLNRSEVMLLDPDYAIADHILNSPPLGEANGTHGLYLCRLKVCVEKSLTGNNVLQQKGS